MPTQPLKNLIPAALAGATSTPSPNSTDRWQPKFDAYEKTLIEARDHASAFVEEMSILTPGRFPRWLSFVGVCGCGKTMLAEQIFAEAKRHNPGNVSLYVRNPEDSKDRRPRCVWFSATEFADAIRRDFGLPEYLARDFLVVIDDVGAARDTTSFIADGLYRLANVRLGKWTIFTSNLGLADVAKQIDERFASRLIRDGNVVHRINAGDYAMRKRS